MKLNPNAMLTTGQVADLIDNDEITPGRVRRLLDAGLVESAVKSSEEDGFYRHWKVPLSALDEVVEAHGKLRKLAPAGSRTHPTMAQFEELSARVKLLEDLYDQYLAPEVAPPSESR